MPRLRAAPGKRCLFDLTIRHKCSKELLGKEGIRSLWVDEATMITSFGQEVPLARADKSGNR